MDFMHKPPQRLDWAEERQRQNEIVSSTADSITVKTSWAEEFEAEGIDEIADELLWSLTPKSSCGCGGYLDYNDALPKIKEILHQELQKARIAVLEEALEFCDVEGVGKLDMIITLEQMKRDIIFDQSELDQPTDPIKST